jgi:DNA-binding transcriptional ArsR family regulator
VKDGPDFTIVASLLGDPARANIVSALMTGQALTAGELAREAGVSAQTASSHLARLARGGLIIERRAGRHRYYALSGADVGGAVEHLTDVAERLGHTRVRPGPKDPALRRARVCYDHLAGELGVRVFDGLVERRFITIRESAPAITRKGEAFLRAFGIETPSLMAGRREVCRLCLDWSERRYHLAGALGAAMLGRFTELGWLARSRSTRALKVTPAGVRGFARTF